MDKITMWRVAVPVKVKAKLDICEKEINDLNNDRFEIFWDDIITAMENRIKVLKK